MSPRKRRTFSPEFMAEAVKLCRVGDRTIKQIARELDLTETSLRRWVRAADEAARASSSNGESLTTSEREELKRLRRENTRLQLERDILKKAAAFFAKESS